MPAPAEDTTEASSAPEAHEALLRQEVRDLWRQRIGPMTAKHRSILGEVLGKEKLKEVPRRPQPHVLRRIYGELAETRAGLYPYIHEKDPRKRADIKLMYAHPVTGRVSTGAPLKNLVDDPDSKESQALAWLYREFVNSGNVGDFSEIFHEVDRRQVDDAQMLLKMQEVYGGIINDDDNADLGKEGMVHSTPPPFITGGSGRLGDLHEGAYQAREDARSERAKPRGNPLPYEEEARNREKALGTLKKKKRDLQKKLQIFNDHAQRLSSKPTAWAAADIESLSETFSTGSIPGRPGFRNAIQLGGKTNEISGWLEDDTLQSRHASLLERYRQVGTSIPTGRMALDAFLEKHFGPRLVGMSDEEKKKFYDGIRDVLLSEERKESVGEEAGGSLATASTEEGEPKKRRSLPKTFALVATSPVWLLPWASLQVVKGGAKATKWTAVGVRDLFFKPRGEWKQAKKESAGKTARGNPVRYIIDLFAKPRSEWEKPKDVSS